MNSNLNLCPKCNKQTSIDFDKDNVKINCQCGYCSTMNASEYKSKIFSDIINDINKGYEQLSTYFKELKDDFINQLKSQINSIESSMKIVIIEIRICYH